MNQNRQKLLIMAATAAAMVMLTFGGAVYLIAANFKTILPFVRENTLFAVLSLALAILLPYAITGVVVHYGWTSLNRRQLAATLDEGQKRTLMRNMGVSDEKDLTFQPNIFESLVIGPSSGTDIIRSFFLDGPHLIDSGLRGFVRNKSLFRFAVLTSDLNEGIRERSFREIPASSLILLGTLVYFSLLIWGLFPYLMAIFQNFTLLNGYVSNFTLADVYKLRKAGREEDAKEVEDLRSSILPWLQK